MDDLNIIKALEQAPVAVKLSDGLTYQVKPLTIRRVAKAAALLKTLQGNPERFKNPDSPEFHYAVADALVAAGDKMPAALALLTGDEAMAKLEDVSLLDLGAIVLAAVKANKASGLKEVFRQAKAELSGTADKK